jgi:hypothetical protein
LFQDNNINIKAQIKVIVQFSNFKLVYSQIKSLNKTNKITINNIVIDNLASDLLLIYSKGCILSNFFKFGIVFKSFLKIKYKYKLEEIVTINIINQVLLITSQKVNHKVFAWK